MNFIVGHDLGNAVYSQWLKHILTASPWIRMPRDLEESKGCSHFRAVRGSPKHGECHGVGLGSPSPRHHDRGLQLHPEDHEDWASGRTQMDVDDEVEQPQSVVDTSQVIQEKAPPVDQGVADIHDPQVVDRAKRSDLGRKIRSTTRESKETQTGRKFLAVSPLGPAIYVQLRQPICQRQRARDCRLRANQRSGRPWSQIGHKRSDSLPTQDPVHGEHAIFALNGSRGKGERLLSPALVDEFVCERQDGEKYLQASRKFIEKIADKFRADIYDSKQYAGEGSPAPHYPSNSRSTREFEGLCRFCPWCARITPATLTRRMRSNALIWCQLGDIWIRYAPHS